MTVLKCDNCGSESQQPSVGWIRAGPIGIDMRGYGDPRTEYGDFCSKRCVVAYFATDAQEATDMTNPFPEVPPDSESTLR